MFLSNGEQRRGTGEHIEICKCPREAGRDRRNGRPGIGGNCRLIDRDRLGHSRSSASHLAHAIRDGLKI